MSDSAEAVALERVPHLDQGDYRRTLGQFATGVTVVTTRTLDGVRVGLTVNSFTSVSLDPPTVLWCLSCASASVRPFLAAARFAINMLAFDQAAVAQRFATRHPDRFSGVGCQIGPGGVPLLDCAIAHLVCRNIARHRSGDHLIFIGAVEHFQRFAGEPLVFHAGEYGRLLPARLDSGDYSGIAPKIKVA
jgi:flavin reductase (DIM6/NTAB) family NADH-FMN oxidoreductase RutF